MLIALAIGIALPVGIAIGAFAASTLTRRKLARCHPSFRCNARVEAGKVRGLSYTYRLARQRATWVHDVLILHRGRFPLRVHALEVESAGGMRTEQGRRVSIVLNLDSGAVIRLMADATATSALVGPFLMAELDHVAKAKPSY